MQREILTGVLLRCFLYDFVYIYTILVFVFVYLLLICDSSLRNQPVVKQKNQ